MANRFTPLLFLLASATLAYSQSESTPPPTKQGDKDYPTTLQNVNPVKYYGPRKEKKKKKGKPVTYNARDEYYDRVESTLKESERREKRYRSGESTDYMKPPYFGHKKAPKIRPIEKRKYCKICGIRH